MSTETDIGTIRLIIKSAVSIALFSLLAGIGLALNAGRENAVVVAAAGALLSIPASCLTGLFGLLAKTSTTHAGSFSTTPVVVTNPSTDPVPVAEAGAETNSTPRTASTL
jgi:hypothetical protein